MISSKALRLLLFIYVGSFWAASPVSACRYNVRETGFVDLGIEPYYLFVFVDEGTDPSVVSDLERIALSVLKDSNIEFEIVNLSRQKDHPAAKCVDKLKIVTFPSAVLVSPDGQLLPVSVTRAGQPLTLSLPAALQGVLISPKRQEILGQVRKAYAAVLLIEGPNVAENKKAKQAAAAAVRLVSEQMDFMPKSIAHPPVVVTVLWRSLATEEILLWSLGLGVEDVNKPHAVIVYGRARWMGPLFKGEQVTEQNLASVLSVSGADCECGFDHRWLQGTMLPANWDGKLQAQAAESLGFDPENPMIKSEIAWIVRRGYGSYPATPLAYQGLFADSQEPNEPREGEPVRAVNDVARVSAGTQPPAQQRPDLAESERPWLKSLYLVVGLTVR